MNKFIHSDKQKFKQKKQTKRKLINRNTIHFELGRLKWTRNQNFETKERKTNRK